MQVWYMNGAGNDFMVMDARGKIYDFSSMAKKLCVLTGADGFMAVDHSAVADFRLHFYNSDGSRGEMCGNGSRCICRFAHELGIVGDTMTVETDAGLVHGRRLSESEYLVQLNLPSILDLHRKGNIAYVELGNPGVPHAVAHIPGLSWEDRDKLRDSARSLRHDAAFPKGANVNLYTWLGENEIRLLTFERGVEDYTLACGTGTASTACVLFRLGQLPGGDLIAHNPGGTLRIHLETESQTITAVFLQGPTEVVKILDIDQ